MVIAPKTKVLTARRAWYDGGTQRLCAEFPQGYVGSILFHDIPDADFESSAPVSGFGVGQSGSVVICRHTDGEETWLPTDMFLPGGFTPPATKKSSRKKFAFVS